jgi:hypothetical protein
LRRPLLLLLLPSLLVLVLLLLPTSSHILFSPGGLCPIVGRNSAGCAGSLPDRAVAATSQPAKLQDNMHKQHHKQRHEEVSATEA